MSFLNCFSHKLSAREERKLKLSDEFQKSGVSSNYNGLADTGLHIEEVPDSEYKRNSDLSGFDTAREHDSSPPTAMAELTTAQAKSNNFQGMKQPLDPSLQFVKELPSHPEYRKEISSIISLGIDDEGLPQHLMAYINDNGHSLPSLFALNKAIQDLRSTDLSMWASRYNLFVLWSADRQHPWDGLPNAEAIAATLEIGRAETGEKATVLLNGVPVTSWDFCRGVFTTRDPVVWVTPTGKEARVNLSLNFGTFFGYTQEDGEEETTTLDRATQSYLGTECHGVMWTADTELPNSWPVAPPIVAGKVNIASRAAALSPGATDPLAYFAGTYNTHYLPNTQGKKTTSMGPELCITHHDGDTQVYCDGVKIVAWAFNPNNVLSWEDEAGNTAWLLFMPLSGGAILMGNVLSREERMHPPSFTIFGEPKDQASRLTPNEVMNSVIGKKVAAGLHVAATFLLGEVLDTTHRVWGGNTQYTPTQASQNGFAPKPLLRHKLKALEKVEDLSNTFSSTFLTSKEDGALDLDPLMMPQLTESVLQYLRDAMAQQQVATNSAQWAERDASETADADKSRNVALATYKASQASGRALEAAEAAAEAEKLATEAASLAAKSGTALALNHALATAQAFNGARQQALTASLAERSAASAALKQVEAGISYHANQKNFDKLREVASASSIACKVLTLASTAVEGWEHNTMASRLSALQAARTAAVEAQECHKSTRRMQPVQSQQMESLSFESPVKGVARQANGLI